MVQPYDFWSNGLDRQNKKTDTDTDRQTDRQERQIGKQTAVKKERLMDE